MLNVDLSLFSLFTIKWHQSATIKPAAYDCAGKTAPAWRDMNPAGLLRLWDRAATFYQLSGGGSTDQTTHRRSTGQQLEHVIKMIEVVVHIKESSMWICKHLAMHVSFIIVLISLSIVWFYLHRSKDQSLSHFPYKLSSSYHSSTKFSEVFHVKHQTNSTNVVYKLENSLCECHSMQHIRQDELAPTGGTKH